MANLMNNSSHVDSFAFVFEVFAIWSLFLFVLVMKNKMMSLIKKKMLKKNEKMLKKNKKMLATNTWKDMEGTVFVVEGGLLVAGGLLVVGRLLAV